MSIVDLLEKGKENAKTRKELCDITGLSDRMIRTHIEQERAKGALILSSSHAKGYYLPADISEIREYVAETRSRIKRLNNSKLYAEMALTKDYILN